MIKKYIALSVLFLSAYSYINAIGNGGDSLNKALNSNHKPTGPVLKPVQQRDEKINKTTNELKAQEIKEQYDDYNKNTAGKSSMTSDQARAQLKESGNGDGLDFSFDQTLGDLIQSIKRSNPNIKFSFKNAKLVYANLTPSDGTSNDLSGVNFAYSNAQGVNFIGCILIGTNFKGAHLAGSYFIATDISNGDFTGAQLQVEQPNVVSYNLVYPAAIVSYATAINTNFSVANLNGVDFTSTDLSSANLNGATKKDAIGLP